MNISNGANPDCSSRRYVAAGAIVAMLVILPVMVSPHLLLLDAPAHESRISILRNLLLPGRGSPFYQIETFFLPNIAFDVIGFALSFIGSPEEVGKIFFALTLILTVSGVAVLNRVVTKRWSITPLASGLLVYNLVTILGFFSYSFGLALVPWALAIRLRLERRLPSIQFLVGIGVAILLLFCHVYAYGIYVVMSAGFVLTALRQKQIGPWAGFLRLMEMFPAGLLFVAMSTGNGSGYRYDSHYSAVKIFGIVKSLTSGSMVGDVAFLTGGIFFLLLITLCARTRLVSSFLPGLMALVALYFIFPQNLASGSYVDVRLPIAILLMLLAGLDVHLRARKLTAIFLTVLTIALVTKQVALAALWRSLSFATDEAIYELNSLPAPSIVMVSECQPESGGVQSIYDRRQPSLEHLGAMSAFDDTRFIANTYAISGQQPIRVATPYLKYSNLQNDFFPTCDARELRRRLIRIEAVQNSNVGRSVLPTFFLLIRPPSSVTLVPAAKLIAHGSKYALYQVPAR
jgi:hypothetical protein